ncbi:MAG TPA: diguanylate cyclase [Acetobacteraceae bacterium]|nr:diguanylate cyclase [Acetobacteraceae bacterium]
MDGGEVAPAPDEMEGLLEFLYLCPHGLVEFDAAGVVGKLNPACLQLLMPLSGGAGAVANLYDALAPYEPDLRHRIEAEAGPRGLVLDGLRIHVGAKPARRRPRLPQPGPAAEEDPLVLSLTVLRLAPNRLMGVMSDISRQVAQDRRLREAEAWFAAVVSGAQDYAFFPLDANGRITDWNASGEKLFSLSEAEALGRAGSTLMPTEAGLPPLATRLDLARREGWHLAEGWIPRGRGGRFWGTSVVSVMQTGEDEPEAFLVVVRDATESRGSAEALRKALCTDQLTGAMNRRHFFEMARDAFAVTKLRHEPVSAIMVDADHFKSVNDTYGHRAGDAVLTGIAAALQGGVRTGRDLVARLGGEEFCVLLPGLNREAAAEVAERLRAAIAEACFDVPGKDGTPVRLAVTASFGVAERCAAMRDADALLHDADAALYAAKAAGRNRVGLAPVPAVTAA